MANTFSLRALEPNRRMPVAAEVASVSTTARVQTKTGTAINAAAPIPKDYNQAPLEVFIEEMKSNPVLLLSLALLVGSWVYIHKRI